VGPSRSGWNAGAPAKPAGFECARRLRRIEDRQVARATGHHDAPVRHRCEHEAGEPFGLRRRARAARRLHERARRRIEILGGREGPLAADPADDHRAVTRARDDARLGAPRASLASRHVPSVGAMKISIDWRSAELVEHEGISTCPRGAWRCFRAEQPQTSRAGTVSAGRFDSSTGRRCSRIVRFNPRRSARRRAASCPEAARCGQNAGRLRAARPYVRGVVASRPTRTGAQPDRHCLHDTLRIDDGLRRRSASTS